MSTFGQHFSLNTLVFQCWSDLIAVGDIDTGLPNQYGHLATADIDTKTGVHGPDHRQANNRQQHNRRD